MTALRCVLAVLAFGAVAGLPQQIRAQTTNAITQPSFEVADGSWEGSNASVHHCPSSLAGHTGPCWGLMGGYGLLQQRLRVPVPGNQVTQLAFYATMWSGGNATTGTLRVTLRYTFGAGTSAEQTVNTVDDWALFDFTSIVDRTRTISYIGFNHATAGYLGVDDVALMFGPAPVVPDCSDGLDNDGDALVDLGDPGCENANDPSEQSTSWICDDGADNDGDGRVDLADPGCTTQADSSEVGDCQNGVDDDGDGSIDVDDPGCSDAADASEYSFLMECRDGLDNDGDGTIDFPADPDCSHPDVPREDPNAPFFMGLGDLPGGGFFSQPQSVSADGSVVVGWSRSAAGSEAFRWTAADGMLRLGDLPGGSFGSTAYDVAADGSTIVGVGRSTSGAEAFRWTTDGGMVGLGDLPGGAFESGAYGVSGDGSVVTGSGSSASGRQAFRWTSTAGMDGLGVLPGFTASGAGDVSADGSVITCANTTSSVTGEACRWTEATGMVGLGNLPGEFTGSFPTSISADGSVLVGQSITEAVQGQAFRWTEATGMVGLGFLPGEPTSWSSARGISADGAIVVGEAASFATGQEPFVWDAANGMRRVADVLSNRYGLGGALAGWALSMAWGISADGHTIVGSGYNPSGVEEAWIAFLPELTGPSCSDGFDNDGDGASDYPADLGCFGAESVRENPKCQDGVDNDQDGRIDFDGGASAGVPPELQTDPDRHCGASWENREAPGGCGLGAELAFLLAPLLWLQRTRERKAR